MRRATRADLGLAVAVAALGQVDVWGPDLFSTNVVGPRWAVSLAYLVMSLALVARRSAPAVTFAVVAGTLAVQAVTLGASEGNGSLLPMLVATYSLAAHAPRAQALVGLAALPLAIALRELNNPQNTTTDDVVNALGRDLTTVAAWLLGAYLRTRRLLVHELRERASAAERQREERAQSAVVEERARIGRELHDVVAHSVSVIVVQAEAAEEMLARDPARAVAPLQAIQRTGRDTLAEMRRLLGALHADGDGPSPAGAAGLARLVAGVRATGLDVDLEVQGSVDGLPISTDRALYRIVQEALTNVLKHARATHVDVRLHRTPEGLSVEVTDDGPGERPAPAATGWPGCANASVSTAGSSTPARRRGPGSSSAPGSP